MTFECSKEQRSVAMTTKCDPSYHELAKSQAPRVNAEVSVVNLNHIAQTIADHENTPCMEYPCLYV